MSECTAYDLQKRVEELETENAQLRKQIVYGFYENEFPEYTQGTCHELSEPITAEEANGLVRKLMEAREQLEEVEGNWASSIEANNLLREQLAAANEALYQLTGYCACGKHQTALQYFEKWGRK